MLTAQTYKELIANGIEDLPPTLLAEVADFVFFIRKQQENPEQFILERYISLLQKELDDLGDDELAHLESEIAGYERLTANTLTSPAASAM
jgi:hypothetical protein